MNKRKARNISFICIFGFVLSQAPFNTMAAKLYKWVDEDGNVHFGDTIPPEHMKDKHSTLSSGGLELSSVDKQKSEQERKLAKQRAEEEAKKAAEQERLNNEQRAYDQQLLETYLTENDLVTIRDRQIATIEGTITLTQSNVKKLEAQAEKLSNEAKSIDANSDTGKKALTELQDTQQQINEYNQFISSRRAEQDKIKAQFNKDLERLRQLLSD